MIESNRKFYKGISACTLNGDISASLWFLMLLLELTLSQLSEWASDSRWHLPQNQKSKRDCYRRKQGGKFTALLCQSAAVDKVTSWISGKIWPWGLSAHTGWWSTMLYWSTYSSKEPGCFLNNRVDTSRVHQQEQSVALQPLHNLTAHTTLPWTGQHSVSSRQNLWQNYLIYIRFHLKLHLKLRSSELLDMVRSWLCPLFTLEMWLMSCKLNHNTCICPLPKEKSFCLKKTQRSLQCMFISI